MELENVVFSEERFMVVRVGAGDRGSDVIVKDGFPTRGSAEAWSQGEPGKIAIRGYSDVSF